MIGGVPAFVTVWAVELGRGSSLEERKGTLSMAEDGLRFDPRDESTATRIAFGDIVKAKRLHGSPVLLVVHAVYRRTAQTAFYFVQPPPMEPPPGGTTIRPSPFSFGRSTKRRIRRQNVSYLGVWNREKKHQLREWERFVRERVAAARARAAG